MSFIDARINDEYLFGFTGGPQFNTLRKEQPSGVVRKKRLWQYPLCKWSTNFALLTDAEREAMRAAFWACGGGFSDFRFKDWDDYRAVHQLFGIGDGTAAPMQLVRNYTFGAVTFSRKITLPLDAVIRDEDDNIVAATVDPLTGLATPAGTWPSGKALYWDGEFDVPVCFESDFNPFTWARHNKVSAAISLIEARR